MARYDVFPNPEREGYLLEVQTNLLDELKTRVVVPLVPQSVDVKPLRRLNPIFAIGASRTVCSRI